MSCTVHSSLFLSCAAFINSNTPSHSGGVPSLAFSVTAIQILLSSSCWVFFFYVKKKKKKWEGEGFLRKEKKGKGTDYGAYLGFFSLLTKCIIGIRLFFVYFFIIFKMILWCPSKYKLCGKKKVFDTWLKENLE